MKKIISFICLIFLGITSAFSQTHHNGQWYSYFDAGKHEMETTITSFSGVSYEINGNFFYPLAGTFSFNWDYSSIGWGGALANNNTTIEASKDGGKNITKVGELTESEFVTGKFFSGNINTATNYIKWDRPTGSTHKLTVYNIAIPLAKHILFDDEANGNTTDQEHDFGTVAWGEASEPYAVSLRSFYTDGDITVSSSLPQVFRVGTTDNTNGLTYAVGANACASKNGAEGAQAEGSTLGDINAYNFNIYYCPQEGVASEGTVTITDGTNTLTINVKGNSYKKDQTITWSQEEGTFLSNITLAAAEASSQLPIEYTFSEDGIISNVNGKLEINGIGTVTITAAQAGDSRYNAATAITKTFTINPAVTYSSIETAVCKGSTYYYEATDSEYEAGTHEVHIANVYGGDSVITLTVNELPTYQNAFDITVCDNALPYIWDEREYNEAGAHTYTYQTVNGCDSVVTLHLYINNTSAYTDQVTVCENGFPFTWNGYNIESAEDNGKTFTTQNAAGCDSVVTLNLTITNVLRTDFDASICKSGLPYVWDEREYYEAGEHTFTYTAISGCDSVVTLHLNINEETSFTDRVEICENALPITWNGYNIESAEDNGKTYTTQNAAGCDSVVTLNLVITPVKRYTETLTLCSNDIPYTWNDIEITEENMNDEHQVTLTAANGCDSIVTLALTINQAYFVSENKTIYVGEAGEWNGHDLSEIEAGYQEIIYEGTTATGCDSICQLMLTILERPTTTYTYEATTCEGTEYTDENFEGLTEEGTYEVTLKNYLDGDSIITLNLHVIETKTTTVEKEMTYGDEQWAAEEEQRNAGEYTLTSTFVSEQGCDSIVTTIITVAKAEQVITWTPDTTVLTLGETLPLTATTNSGLEITYTLSDETMAAIEENILTALATGELTITASQEGNENYEAAEDVAVTITIMPETGISEVASENNGLKKVIVNGRLYIIVNGKVYNAEGRLVE